MARAARYTEQLPPAKGAPRHREGLDAEAARYGVDLADVIRASLTTFLALPEPDRDAALEAELRG